MNENEKLLAHLKCIEVAWHNFKAGETGLYKPDSMRLLRNEVDLAFKVIGESFAEWGNPKPKDSETFPTREHSKSLETALGLTELGEKLFTTKPKDKKQYEKETKT